MDARRVEPELLDHLAVEFGAHGRRAVDFLLTAEHLLDLEGPLPSRMAEAIAYSLREAMKTIPASQGSGDGGAWKRASREVVAAKKRYEIGKGLPGEDDQAALDKVLRAVDDLELIHAEEGVHERRLIAVIVNRTGALPLAAGAAPVRTYQGLLERLDKGLHGDISMEEARTLWRECLAILRQLFLPPEVRHAELELLAAVESPTTNDVAALARLVASPNHLRHFLSRVASTEWLEVLTETGMLDPPEGQAPWPPFAAVEHLAPEHPEAVARWLERMYERCGRSAARAWFVARAALDVGTAALPLVVRAVRDHPHAAAVVSLGVWGAEEADASSELLDAFADLLLNEAAWPIAGFVDRVIDQLVEGLDSDNAERRLRLVCFKLRSVNETDDKWRSLDYERAGSIAALSRSHRDDRCIVLLNAVVDVVREAQRWLPPEQILPFLDQVPGTVGARLRVWLLADAQDVDAPSLVQELARGIATRFPTGDDLRLLERVTEDCDDWEFIGVWRQALCTAPGIEEVGRALSSGTVPEEWLRAFEWISILPEEVAADWAQPFAVISGAYGRPSRERFTTPRETEAGWRGSPMSVEELQALDPKEAAQRVSDWRPDPSQWLFGARELARTLEEVVKSNPSDWLATPLNFATTLRHPTYINHYLRAVAEQCRTTTVPVDELLDLIVLVRTHPWEATPLGRDDFDFDADWRPAERAGVDVIKALADGDIGFGDRADDAWAIIRAEVRNRREPSGILSGARDPLDTAINRPCTRALETALSLMAHEFRTSGAVRPEALQLLEESLSLNGSDGAEHRAIIAPRLAFLRHIASGWVDDQRGRLLGKDAPDELGQLTIDQAIKWASPNAWLLENYRPSVCDAVVRGVEHALEHVLIAMLWESPGYSVDDTVTFLRSRSELLSEAGEGLGRLLRHDEVDARHIAIGAKFWRAALNLKSRQSLRGFGWFAEVKQLDPQVWATLTLTTLRQGGGRIEWSHKVAERAVALGPTGIALAIINELVRGTVDEWDRRGTVEMAVDLLGAAPELEGTAEYAKLKTTLLERGVLLIAKRPNECSS